jgi:hypothetical protein
MAFETMFNRPSMVDRTSPATTDNFSLILIINRQRVAARRLHAP